MGCYINGYYYPDSYCNSGTFEDVLEWVLGFGVYFGVPLLLIGGLFLFFGLKIFKCITAFIGFCIGFVAGAYLGVAAQSLAMVWLLGLAGGVAVAIIMVKFRKVAYCFYGISFGSSIASVLNVFVIANNVSNPNTAFLISTIILAIVGGIIGIYIGDIIVIIATAILGSYTMTIGTLLCVASKLYSSGSNTLALFLIEFIFLGALGIWYQNKRREEWKGVLVYNENVINNTVSNNVNNANNIQIKIDQPVQYSGMAYPQQGYGVPFMQNPYGQYPTQPAQPDQQYAAPQMYSQPPVYSQAPYGQPQGFQPEPVPVQQPEFAKPVA